MSSAVLLDTHVVLWLSRSAPRLGQNARETIFRAPKAYISAASVWESAIKVNSGKVHAPPNLMGVASAAGLCELPVLAWHAGATDEIGLRLPHRDPFDAMLVTQASLEDLTLVTADRQLLGTHLCRTLDAAR